MKVCKKCNIEKEDSCFYTYFHSNQGKYRTRNNCIECEYQRAREYKRKVRRKEVTTIKRIFKPKMVKIELIEPDITKNPNFKLCNKCKEYLPIENFYPAQRNISSSCKECSINDTVKRNLLKSELGLFGDTKKPNTYTSEEQRVEVFMIMEVMGWTYNDNGVWSKYGIKDKDKKWANIKRRRKYDVDRPSPKILKSVYRNKELPEVKLKYKQQTSPDDETINNILNDFFKTDSTKKEISLKYNVSIDRINTYIYKLIDLVENEKKQ